LVPVLPVIAVMVELAPEGQVVILIVAGVMILVCRSAYHFEKMHISFQVPDIVLSYPGTVSGEIDIPIVILVRFFSIPFPSADE
jgi:hypothetical protein